MAEEVMHTSIHTHSKRFSRYPLAAAISLALAVTSFPMALQAQSAGDESVTRSRVIEEVVVTAQRREQSLQEVPMAISAFTGQQLAELQADNLDSLQGAVPNLNLVQGRGSNSS